jgi:hypothetical protein
MKLAIIDLDPFLYSNGFAIETWNEDKTVKILKPNHTLQNAYWNIDAMMRRTLAATEAEEYVGYLTPSLSENFRISIDPLYKANRKNAKRPIYYNEIKQYVINKWDAEITVGQEADDACSIHHCKENNFGFHPDIINSVVCSIDKDFNNIPGWHYNPGKPEQGLYYIEPIQALRNFYLQILTGDNSDGIPRIKKGWKKSKVEKQISMCKKESELLDIVYNEIYNILYMENNKEFRIGKSIEIDREIKKIIIDRGRLVWLRRENNEMWLPNYFGDDHE